MVQFWNLLKEGQKEKYRIAYINARIIDPETRMDIRGSLLTEGKYIVDFGENLFSNVIPRDIDEIIDCKGKALIPGIIDIHVHFREPGQEHKEDIHTGSKSAAAGGVTTVVCQPNTVPPIDDIIIARYLKYRAFETSYVNVEFYASITKNGDKLSEMSLLKDAGAVGFTDDGLPVMDSFIMRQALLYSSMLNVPIAQHAEDLNLSNGGCINEGVISEELGLKGILDTSESIIVARDISLMKNINNIHYHVLHVSTLETLNVVKRAKMMGLNVTCEVAPHHFILNENAIKEFGSLAKMNPPLRTEEDRRSMIEGLSSGIIDCIATDHAPHEDKLKNLSISDSAFGIIGLETLFPLSLELYHNRHINLIDVLGKLTYKAADIIRVPRGRIRKNFVADLTLVDIDHDWIIEISKFSSKSQNSPFNMRKVRGKVLRTIVKGKTVYCDNT